MRLLSTLCCLLLAACNTTAESKRFTRDETSGLLKKLEERGLKV